MDRNELAKLKREDIVDITILKNLSAEVFYSCRPSGGVILITTRLANERKIVVIDESGSPLPGATVAIVPGASISDTLFFTADDKGIVSTNKLKKNHNYEMAVSHVGYEIKKASLSKKSLATEVILNKKSTVCLPVYVKSYGRTIRCGIRVKSIRGEEVKAHGDDYGSYKVYPNPARPGSIINIQLPEKAAGKIKLKLYDLSGHMVMQTEIIAESKIQKIQLPQMPAGNYHLVFSNKKSEKLFASKLLIL